MHEQQRESERHGPDREQPPATRRHDRHRSDAPHSVDLREQRVNSHVIENDAKLASLVTRARNGAATIRKFEGDLDADKGLALAAHAHDGRLTGDRPRRLRVELLRAEQAGDGHGEGHKR